MEDRGIMLVAVTILFALSLACLVVVPLIVLYRGRKPKGTPALDASEWQTIQLKAAA